MTHALLLAMALAAPSEPSIDFGRELFASPDLGANGKTCVQCHGGGQSFDPEELRAASPKETGIFVNHCLTLRMKSQKLAPETVEHRALVLYVKTFQQKGR